MKSKVMLSVLMLTCMALNVNLAWGAETLVETIGFESSEGYTSSTTYNSADYTTGTSGSKWTINYGAFSTSSAIVGSQSAQFRVYSAGNYGQLRNAVAYEIDITKVVFNARVSNTNSSIKVSYSADGTSWTDIETVSFSGTTMVEHTSTISVSGARYIKFTAAGSKPSSGNYQIYIDAVKIYTGNSITYTDYLTECPSVDKDEYTISWNANGTTTTSTVTEGEAIGAKLPTAPTSCSDTYTHFVGWFTDAAGSDDSPSKALQGTQVTAATVPTGDATYYAVFSDEQLSGELILATSIANGDKIYLATSSTGTGVAGADGNKDAIVSTTKGDWMLFTVVDYSAGTFKLKNGANYVTGASGSFKLTEEGTQLSLNNQGYFTFTSGNDTYCLLRNNNTNGIFYRCYKTSNIGTTNYTQFFMYKAGTPATGYISSCCTDAAVVTITPASSTVNIGADGNATTTVTCTQTDGGEGEWTYSISPSDGATFDGSTFTATQAGTYTLTATYTETCGKSGKTTITVTKKPTLYFTTEPDNPIVFDDPQCGGNTTLGNEKSVALQGYNLTDNVTVTITGDYKIASTASAELGDYTTSLTLDKTAEGKINDNYQTIYILSTPPAAKTDATEGTLTITTEGGNTLTVNLSTPTITCAEYTLTFVDRGGTHQTVTQYAGTKVAEPAAPTGVCTDPIHYVFDGWAEATVSAGSTSYTKVTFPYTMPNNNTTKLYAVYKYVETNSGTPEWVKVQNSTEITSGSELVLASIYNGETIYKYMPNAKATSNPTLSTITTVQDDKITSAVTSDMVFVYTTDKYLQSKADEANYLYTNSSTGENIRVGTTKSTWTFTTTESGQKWDIKNGQNHYLAVYGSTAWRNYSNNTTNQNGVFHIFRNTASGAATLYTTSPVCGPHVGVSGDVRITSAKGVRVDAYTKISVRATNLDKNTGGNGGAPTAVSIKAESNNPNFKIKRWGDTDDGHDAYSGNNKSWAFATNITAANYEDSLCITYTPTASDTTESATITLTAYRYNGSTPYATNTITVQGHSLPERFVIAAQSETGWVALPNTLGSSSNATVPNAEDISNEVDPSDNPTKLTTAPSNVIYTAVARANKNNSQTGLRFTVDGTQFLQASKSDTKVWLPTDNSQDMQSWTLRTEDFVNYQARLDSAEAGRYLAYNSGAGRIGHYKANTPIRFLPFDEECTRLLAPANLKVTQVKSSAITLTWDAVTGATGYAYSTDDGTTWTEMGNVLAYTITGLKAAQPYTIWVKGVVPEGDTDCSYYGTVSETTADCDDVPYDISYTSDANSITLSWTMTSDKATVQVFSDADGKTQVGSDYTDKTSPFTITGLTKATTYYVKILAGGKCSSALKEVSTERPQLDVVEWKTNGIDVAINTNEKISVVLENQVTKGTGTGKVAKDLFFSKYFEGRGSLKLLGIFNGTNADINLADYTLLKGQNGDGTIGTEFNLSTLGTIKQGQEIILFAEPASTEGDVYNCSMGFLNDKKTKYGEDENPRWILCDDKQHNGITFPPLNFSGDDPLILRKNGVAIDVFGVSTKTTPPTKITICPERNDECWVADNVSNMDYGKTAEDFGGTIPDGVNIDDEYITAYTARVIMFRSNLVESGADAVAQNISTFTTFSTEWQVRQVCRSGDDGDLTCAAYTELGVFDYSGYYTTYDSLTTVEFDNSNRNPDGTLTISIPCMDMLACKGLKIIAADESGNVLTTKEYRVPILITENASTNSTKYFRFSGDTCKTCDVVIRNNATLTKEADGADNDKPQVRDVMVYEGSSLVVPSGTNYTVNSLSLRRREDAVAVADVAGRLNINSTSDKPVYLDMRINAENWHWFTLPYDCAIADVTWSNGQPAKYRTDWFLMYYDGAHRATGVDSGNWKEYTGNSIAAGQGFIIGIKGDGNDKHAFELRFPMAKEVITKDATNKTVPVYAYGAGTDVRPNHKGWNLVGNPYLNYYKKNYINSFDGLQLSELIYDDVTGWWSLGTNNLPYVVIPINFGWSAYQQVLVSAQDLLPFTSYFIQVGRNGDTDGKEYSVNFTSANRGKLAKAALMTSNATEAEEEPVITGIVLRNAQGESDETSLVIAEQFGSSYEMGADFFKWFGDYYKYYTLPVLYSIGDDGGKRAFNAVNEAGAKQSIPLGMYAARDGEYTFSLNTRSDLSRVDKVWLYDAESGLYTDLLREDYTFATTRTEGSGRFFLSVVLKEKEITTGASDVRYGELRLSADKQTLVVRGLPEAAEVWVYDPSGKLLHHEQTRHYERHYAVPQQGTYLVRVESKDGAVTLRGVCR